MLGTRAVKDPCSLNAVKNSHPFNVDTGSTQVIEDSLHGLLARQKRGDLMHGTVSKYVYVLVWRGHPTSKIGP
jgi:hypothetical protein